MNSQALEKFCEEKGRRIVNGILESYDSADFQLSPLPIEEEIYEVATSYARIFFFEKRSFLDKKAKEMARGYVNSSFDVKRRKVDKMNHVELTAHLIKHVAVKELEDQGLYLF